MYTLRFPFLLTNNISINNLDRSLDREFNDLHIKLEFIKPYYVLTVKGLKSEDEAKGFKEKLKLGLQWATLICNFGFKDELEFDNVFFSPDPNKAALVWKDQYGIDKGERIDCIINGNLPSVYPSKFVAGIITGGIATMVLGKNPDVIIDSILEGLAISNSQIIISDRLKISIDLYNSHFFEQSGQAKFLSLIMALESIAPHNLKQQIAIEFIDKWATEINQKIPEYENDSNEYHALESLQREIQVRKEASLRSQIRSLILETLNDINDEMLNAYTRRAVELYDLRSTLVHDGVIENEKLEKALVDTKEIVLLVLKRKLKNN